MSEMSTCTLSFLVVFKKSVRQTAVISRYVKSNWDLLLGNVLHIQENASHHLSLVLNYDTTVKLLHVLNLGSL